MLWQWITPGIVNWRAYKIVLAVHMLTLPMVVAAAIAFSVHYGPIGFYDETYRHFSIHWNESQEYWTTGAGNYLTFSQTPEMRSTDLALHSVSMDEWHAGLECALALVKETSKMSNGSLVSHHFHQDDSKVLNWSTRYQIAVGSARGLAHLHDKCRDYIIHCDIKPENILLDADFTPKLASFGLAKLIGREFSSDLTILRLRNNNRISCTRMDYRHSHYCQGICLQLRYDVF
ncbi:hypothetical protein Sjap_003492 [Stephania japonica]|uniref:Protein kinase domain-containing protein n=1 Tax=Stephania japonica TaxID=461633 RepID=A0AAP0KNV4_9MAGN